jgi:16S rRNA (cytidine1402-2'-O)-methyltransferase
VTEAGCLVVVGTPIGNLGDLSPRARAALSSADAIACEDTRRTGRLLSLTGLAAPALLVVNEHTEVARTGEIMQRLAQGQRVALVSDAGMPTVSDPGRRLVDSVARAGYRVEVVPGPVAAVTALAVSGFEAERFVFEGFLPRKGAARVERLAGLAVEPRTIVMYEAPHRLRRTLADLVDLFGPDRPVAVVRELTKLHEEVLRLTLAGAVAHFTSTEPRGELVIVVSGFRPVGAAPEEADLVAGLEAALGEGMSRRDAVTRVAAATGAPRRQVYDLANRLTAPGRSGCGEPDDG